MNFKLVNRAAQVTTRRTVAFYMAGGETEVLGEIPFELFVKRFGARSAKPASAVLAFEGSRKAIEKIAAGTLADHGIAGGELVLNDSDFELAGIRAI